MRVRCLLLRDVASELAGAGPDFLLLDPPQTRSIEQNLSKIFQLLRHTRSKAQQKQPDSHCDLCRDSWHSRKLQSPLVHSYFVPLRVLLYGAGPSCFSMVPKTGSPRREGHGLRGHKVVKIPSEIDMAILVKYLNITDSMSLSCTRIPRPPC